MRNFKAIIDHTQKWEGEESRDKNDSASVNACPLPYKGRGGVHTMKGVTYASWVATFGKGMDEEFLEMSDEHWLKIYMKYYRAVSGDSFSADSIAFFLTQVAWGSGPAQAGKTIQKALNSLGAKLKVDGVIGNLTIHEARAVILRGGEKELFDAMFKVRKAFFESIAKGKNSTFLKGWMNRLNDFYKTFQPK